MWNYQWIDESIFKARGDYTLVTGQNETTTKPISTSAEGHPSAQDQPIRFYGAYNYTTNRRIQMLCDSDICRLLVHDELFFCCNQWYKSLQSFATNVIPNWRKRGGSKRADCFYQIWTCTQRLTLYYRRKLDAKARPHTEHKIVEGTWTWHTSSHWNSVEKSKHVHLPHTFICILLSVVFESRAQTKHNNIYEKAPPTIPLQHRTQGTNTGEKSSRNQNAGNEFPLFRRHRSVRATIHP